MGLLQTLGQEGTSESQTTQHGLSLQVSYTGDKQELREAATGRLLPGGAWEGLSRGPGIPSVPLQAFCARFNSQFRLLFSNSVVWKFFSSQENTIKLRSQRLLTGERFQAKTTPSRCFARSGRGGF